MEIEKKFYVYVDFRGDDGKPFYVGKGAEKRIKNLHRNPLHTNIKKKHGMVRKILFENLSENESFEREIQLIGELQTHIDHGNGGANLTLGGEGGSGYKFTNEQREKCSEASKKRWETPEYREKMREAMEDPEYREKMSESNKKKWEDPEHRNKTIKAINSLENIEKMRERSRKTWENPEHRKNVSESIKKTWEDPEHREKVSKLIKDHHNDPEFKKKQGEKIREVLSDPEIREKISRITKEKLSDPEVRKKISEKVKLSAEKLTSEQRSEKIRKGWETRRLKKLQQEI
jgi:hypothetical protein